MSTNTDKLTEDIFHEHLHKDIDKPVKSYRVKWGPDRKRKTKVSNGAHGVPWASATINTSLKVINIQVFLNFNRNGLLESDYTKLKNLACEGIKQYWTRNISINCCQSWTD